MKKSLPDYYRVLKVEPTVSDEVIKASYRKLMVTLKMHPDFGGDHEAAVQINEAYAVLGNRTKRIQYDRMFLLQQLRTASIASDRPQKRTTPNPVRTAETRASSAKTPDAQSARCPLCGAAQPRSVGPETRCEYCRSPLNPPPQTGAFGRELFGRRAAPRTAKSHAATIQLARESQVQPVKMHDLSLGGMSFYCERALEPQQRLTFRDANLEAVAAVISCSKRGQLYLVHAQMLTVTFHHKAGVFVSTSR